MGLPITSLALFPRWETFPYESTAPHVGLIARRIVCWAQVGRGFERGERIGLIRFGSRVDVYLPAGAVEVLAAPGLIAKAGVTPLARWRVAP